MRKLLIILLSVLSLPTVAQQQKVAVYVTGDEVEAKVLGSRLQTDITRSGKYTVIERNATFLAELKKEQSYQRTGAVNDEELSRLGKQFGVSLICVADIFSAFGESYVSARLINVVSAEVLRTASASGNLQNLENMMSISSTIVGDLLTQVEEKEGRKKVAVYIAQSQSKEIGRVLGDKLVAGFTLSGQYTAVERTNSFLSQLNKEQKYQRTGEVDDNDISRLGKQFGVQYVCVAEVSDYYEDQKYIAARLVDVETAELVDAFDGGGSINSMSSCVKMANKIAGKLSRTEDHSSKSSKSVVRSVGEYIDLGLPSGTLWNNENEDGFYTISQAINKYSKQLPTKDNFYELINSCQWKWVNNGYIVIGPNGASIFLPAMGFRDCNGQLKNEGVAGKYCSSTIWERTFTHYLYFGPRGNGVMSSSSPGERCLMYSVRLISN